MINSVILLTCVLFCAIAKSQFDQFERQKSFISCKADKDCFDNSVCIGNDDKNFGKCQCLNKYILVDRNRTHYECLLAAEVIGAPCTRDIQCQVNFGALAACRNQNECQCAPEAHLGDDNMCYKDVALGDFCLSNYNCLLGDGSYGFCVDGKCVCNIKHHPTEDRKDCIASVPLGKVCQKHESCIHTFANCFDGVCRCITGYVESDDNSVCLKAAARVGDNCTESIQCSAYLRDSFCKNSACMCKSAHHNYGNECVPDAKLGERCNSNKECIFSEEMQYSVKCEEGVCQCVKDVSDANSYGCVVVPNGQVLLQPKNILIFILVALLVKKNV